MNFQRNKEKLLNMIFLIKIDYTKVFILKIEDHFPKKSRGAFSFHLTNNSYFGRVDGIQDSKKCINNGFHRF